jgi:hypothetical protein
MVPGQGAKRGNRADPQHAPARIVNMIDNKMLIANDNPGAAMDVLLRHG